ncbi:MAG: DNA topoisomerase IB [Gemmataceae bacterium]
MPTLLAVKLTYVCDSAPGICRLKAAATFRYRAPDGRPVRNTDELARIRSLAIPPAWTDVWICPDPHGHIQATGKDARGRKQYRYHPAWRAERDGTKFDRLSAFGGALSQLRQRIDADLARPGLPREKVLAAVVHLLDRTHLRVGNAEYARTNNSFGLSTLKDRHVTFAGDSLRLKFRGKSGVWHDRAVTDRRLARIVRACRDLPGQHLFQYAGEDGEPRAVGSADVNGYIREAAGGEFTAKVFRTWAGTVGAAVLLSQEPANTVTSRKRAVVRVVKEVAVRLGNTPAVCRASYIHPRVIDAYLAGGFTLPAVRRPPAELSAAEARVLRFLAAAVKPSRSAA